MSSHNPKTRKERLVVVGGCAAGMSAASKARRLRPEMEVVALEKTPHVSYSACGIPYYVADFVRQPSDLVTVTPEEFRSKRNIAVFTRHEVVDIKPVQRQVTAVEMETNKEMCWHYDRLLISVGGLPNRPDIPGIDLQNIFTIQTLQDGIRIKQLIDERRPKRVAIVGGGYIAMEMAEACRVRGLQVNLLEKRRQILLTFEENIVEAVRAELSRNQVTVQTQAQIVRFAPNGLNEVTQVLLAGTEEALPVDFVLVCAGLAPNTRLAEIAGVRPGKTGAIGVDWKMQTSVPNIYAAGDCVEVKNLVSGKPDYIPLGPTANKQGRVAGENIGGGTAIFRGVAGTSVFKTFELEVARTGLCARQARSHSLDVDMVTITERSKAGYYPGAQPMTVCVVFDRRSGRLLGAQMVGREGVSKRIDVFAAALLNKMTLEDLASLDLSYAPPFAPVWDPVLVAVNVARGKLHR
ncbi:MAG: FAD-dependent oxidoreductase [bacterium]